MYDGSIRAVKAAAGSNLVLHQVLDGVQGTTPEIIKSAVENPIPKLTLKDTLEKNRKEIIYNIKREVNTGLLNGDRYTTVECVKAQAGFDINCRCNLSTALVTDKELEEIKKNVQ